VETKFCCKCGEQLELSSTNFFARKDSKDGFRNDCKDCRKKVVSHYYKKNRGNILSYQKKYQNKNIDKIKIQRKEHREENKDLIKQRRNVEIDNATKKKYWEKNKERLKVEATNWKKKNSHRVKLYKKNNCEHEKELARKRYRTEEGRKKAQMRRNSYISKKNSLINDLTLEEWNKCLIHFNNQCSYCECENGTLEQDHFIPVTKNGAYSKNNILPACRSCNASKSNHDFLKWYQNQLFYSRTRKQIILDYIGNEKEIEV